jgi:flagellar basal body-associated protein FliL
MPTDSGSWLWLVIDVLFVVALAGGLIYGMMMYRNRRSARTEQATRELYQREAEKERRSEGEPPPRRAAG